jgi:hypothetical protein
MIVPRTFVVGVAVAHYDWLQGGTAYLGANE